MSDENQEIRFASDGTPMKLYKPDQRVFLNPELNASNDWRGGEFVYDLERIEYPKTGGIYQYNRGMKFPIKGQYYRMAILDDNAVKRVFISLVNFFTDKRARLLLMLLVLVPFKRKLFEAVLCHLNNYSENFMKKHYIQFERMTENCRELQDFIARFFLCFGFAFEGARLALVYSHMIQYDTAYRYVLLDIFSETTKEKLLANPAEELKRLFDLAGDRTIDKGQRDKIKRIGKFLGYIFWIPGIKKAFLFAIEHSNFKNFQYDEIDHAAVLFRDGYNFFGEDIDKRTLKYIEINGGLPPQYKVA